MYRTMMIAGTILLLAAGSVAAQQQQKPATGASAQGATQGQASASANQEGASATGSATGAAGAQEGDSSANLAQGTEINATLTKPVDAGKAKPGDPVEARAAKDIRSGGEVVVPRGSKLMGRVTQAEPRRSGSAGGSAGGSSASQLGIVFDRAVLKDGRSVALNGAVAALGAARAAASSGGGGAGGAASGSGGLAGSAAGSAGGLAGGVGGTVGGIAGTTAGAAGNVGATIGGTASAAARSAGAVGGFDAAGNLRSGSRGVFGLRDLEIASATQGSAGGSVISSTQRNVRLEGGTQMLIVAGARAAEQSAESTDSTAPAEPRAREAKDDRR